jgi:hypothetical protein
MNQSFFIAEGLADYVSDKLSDLIEWKIKSEEYCPARPYSDSWETWYNEQYLAQIQELNKNLPTEDTYHLENYTQDDFEMLCGIYYDSYKEKHGIKPRWVNFSTITLAEIVSMLNLLSKQPYCG